MSMMRRRLLDDTVRRTAEGEAIAVRSVARMRPGLSVFGKSTQDTTTGAQLFDASQLNLPRMVNGVTATLQDDGGIKLEGTTGEGQFAVFSELLQKEEYQILTNPGYITSFVNDINENVYILFRVIKKMSSGETETLLDVSASTKNTIEFSGEDYDEIQIGIQVNPNTTVNKVFYPVVNYGNDTVQFEKYTGGKPSPNPDYPQEIMNAGDDGSVKVGVYGANLFDANVFSSEQDADVTVTVEGSTISVASQDGATPWRSVQRSAVANLELFAGHVMMFSGEVVKASEKAKIQLQYKTKDDMEEIGVSDKVFNLGIISGQTGKFSVPIELPVDISFIRVCLYTNYSDIAIEGLSEIVVKDLFLHEGSTALPYEPYKTPQSLTAQTPNGLPGIPVTSGGNYTDGNGQQWVCDEIDFKRGKYVKRCAKEVLTGTPNFYETSDIAGRFMWNNFMKNTFLSGKYDALSNFAKWSAWGAPLPTRYIFALNNISLYFSPTITMTAEEVNAMFAEMITSDNPPYVIGQLATPIETDLTPEQITAYQSLHTNYPTTTIMNDSDAGMKLTYKTRKSLEVTT